VYFVFKPKNFVKTDGAFVYKEKYCPVSHKCFVKNVLEMKRQVICLCKGQASFFYEY